MSFLHPSLVEILNGVENDKILMKISSICKNLRTIKLTAQGMHGTEAITSLFENCRKLQNVEFNSSLCGSDALSGLADNSVSLKKVSFGSFQWSDTMCHILAHKLIPDCLIDLKIHNFSDKVSDGLTALLNGQRNLKKLSLNHVNDKNVVDITTHCIQLTSLRITTYETISDSSFLLIASNLPELKILSVLSEDTNSNGAVMEYIHDCSFEALMEMQGGKLHFHTVFEQWYWPCVLEECWKRVLVWAGNDVL